LRAGAQSEQYGAMNRFLILAALGALAGCGSSSTTGTSPKHDAQVGGPDTAVGSPDAMTAGPDALTLPDSGAAAEVGADVGGAPDAASADAPAVSDTTASDTAASDTATSDTAGEDAQAPDATPDAEPSLPDVAPDVVAKCGHINCDCTFNGHLLRGRIQYVTGFPYDVKAVEVTNNLPDLYVQEVPKPGLTTQCGQWQPDVVPPLLRVLKVQPPQLGDFTIQFVQQLPGIPGMRF
jgi:hypothetical protein